MFLSDETCQGSNSKTSHTPKCSCGHKSWTAGRFQYCRHSRPALRRNGTHLHPPRSLQLQHIPAQSLIRPPCSLLVDLSSRPHPSLPTAGLSVTAAWTWALAAPQARPLCVSGSLPFAPGALSQSRCVPQVSSQHTRGLQNPAWPLNPVHLPPVQFHQSF